MSESTRFRSLEGILAKPATKRQPLPAVDPTDDTDPSESATASRTDATSEMSEKSTPSTDTRAQTARAASPRPSTPGRTRREQATQPARAAQPNSQTTGGTRRVPFRLGEDLARGLTERVSRDGTSQAHVVLDAIEAAHIAGTLGDLVAAEQRPTSGAGALFTRPAVRGAATASVATEIRLDAGTLAVLDELVDSTGAATRTQLIIASLKDHLA
ncbi:hypothetical protein [Solicola sp. PLA-1-18]|uniref:hypothetical protein n=1 Tax=Solicola sp. PLA-1-18 TaxID=3380532 RepID=UPI003B7A525F